MPRHLVAVGTYTSRHPWGSRLGRGVRNLLAAGKPRSRGIYLVGFDSGSARFDAPREAARLTNPSWLARHPTSAVLYAVSESAPGAVAAFRFSEDGLLDVGHAPSGGDAPCFLGVDPTGRYLCVANYDSGSVGLIGLHADGSLGGPTEVRMHRGAGPDRARQQRAHPHAICFSPSGQWMLVPDLGADCVWVYARDPASGSITDAPRPFATAPGAGPRHMVFDARSQTALLVNELSNTLASYHFDETIGRLEPAAVVSTLPAGYRDHSTAADVRVHARPGLAFVSNRGHDSITTVAVDADGRLDVVGVTGTGGKTPRGLGIDPTGSYLLAAHQDSDELVALAISEPSGMLEVAARLTLPTCTCALFL
jgi:6-phosphogluconolactonase